MYNVSVQKFAAVAAAAAPPPITAWQKVFRLFCKHGTKDYIGEPISQLEHAIQTAQHMRSIPYASKHLIAASLLHDVGQMIETAPRDKLGTYHHEFVGANLLHSLGFPQSIWQPVQYHVMAKRYLVTIDASYRQKLSEASISTLIQQGGLLTNNQLKQFEQHQCFSAALLLRQCDDKAKTVTPTSTQKKQLLFEFRKIMKQCMD